MATELVLELPNDIRSIGHAVDYVMERCTACCEQAHKLDFNLRVGLTEALSNAMLYGNADDPAKRVRIEIVVAGTEITARITDEGSGFDPDEVPDPTTPANVVKTGGRGIFLMRSLLDEVTFNAQGNSVKLVLRLEPTVSPGDVDGGTHP
ncbi:MAG: ATP-binding protein [Longimicrobiales bacterium]